MRLDPPEFFYCNRCKGQIDNYFHGEDGVCVFCLEDLEGEE